MNKYSELYNKIMRGENSVTRTPSLPKTKAIVPKRELAPLTREVSTPAGKRKVPLHDRQRYKEVTRQGYQQALQDNAGARFHAGLMEGLSPVGLGLESEALEGSKAFLGGNVAGTMGQFAIPYAGVAPKIGKALTKVPRIASMGKLGQGIARSVATDVTVGLPLNINYALNKEGLRGKDALKSIGVNSLIDLATGGLIEIVPAGAKGLKHVIDKRTGKVMAQATDEVVDAAIKALPEPQQFSLLQGRTMGTNLLPGRTMGTNLLPEGINWTQGQQPVRQLTGPKIFVDEAGGAGFMPMRDQKLATETIPINKRITRVEGFIPDPTDAITGGETVFTDSYMEELKALLGLSKAHNIDAKDVIKRGIKSIQPEIDDAVEQVAKTFRNYEPQGVDLIPQHGPRASHYGSDEFRMIRSSRNAKWYSDLYKQYGRKPPKQAMEEVGREYALHDIKYAIGEFIDPEIAEAYNFLRRMEGVSDLYGKGLKDVVKNADGSYSFIHSDNVKVVKPDYKSAKGKAEMPFAATADEISFAPKATQRKSSQLGLKPKQVKAPSKPVEPRKVDTPTKTSERKIVSSKEHVVEMRVGKEIRTVDYKTADEAKAAVKDLNKQGFDAKVTGDTSKITGDDFVVSFKVGNRTEKTAYKTLADAKDAVKDLKKQGFDASVTKQPRSVGAMGARPKLTIEESIAKYGKIEPGMEPRARDARIPKATDYGDVQKGIRTSAEAKAVNDASYKAIQEAVEDGMATKFTVGNKSVVEKASKTINSEGLGGAYSTFKSVIKAGKQPKSEDIALGYRLMQEYQKTGNYQRVSDIAIDVSEMLSETGRTLQASRIIKQLTPEGRLISVKRTVKKMSDKSGKQIKLKDDTLKAIMDAKTDKEITDAIEKAAVEAWNQVPSGLQNKMNAWRYMSMLMNPKTHVRNIVGNALFMPARGLKNVIGTGLEKTVAVPIAKREGVKFSPTKAVLTTSKTDKAYLKLADNEFKNVVDVLRGEAKFDEGYRHLQAKVFKSKWLEWARDKNMKALDLEDVWFMRAAYDSSFAQYLKANKVNPNKVTNEMLRKASDYASSEALRATYRDASQVATGISRLKRKLATSQPDSIVTKGIQRAGGMLIEGVMPFTKTPINILKRGVEYSPVGVFSGFADIANVAKNGGDLAKALDRLSAGLSGSMVMLLGAMAGKNKWVVGGHEEMFSSKKTQHRQMQGLQEYALDTGDGTYTLDWANPMSMPFFIGVEFGKEYAEGNGSLMDLVNAMTKIDEPLFNMSMLQGVNDALRSYGTEQEAITAIGTNMAVSYLSQFVPTVGGQIARTVHDTRRSAMSVAESPVERKIEKAWRRQMGKIPIAYEKNEPYIDLWGRTESSGGAIQNFINPGYYKSKNITKVDEEINRLVGNVSEEIGKNAIPKVTNSYSIKQGGEEYRFTAKELTQFRETRGKASYDKAKRLIESSAYKALSDEEKVKALDGVYKEAYKIAKEDFLRRRNIVPKAPDKKEEKKTRF